MSYIKKTLTAGEVLIVSKKLHWLFWMAPWPLFLIVFCIGSSVFLLIFLFTEASKLDFVFSWLIFGPSFIGLLYYFIKYISIENVVTNKRVVFKRGFIYVDTDELRMERLENIQIKQSLLGRIFRYGDLEFKGTGGSAVVFKLIANPISTKKKIEIALSRKAG